MTSPARKAKKPADYLVEIEGLRVRLEEAEETLRAIRRGDIDGLVVQGGQGSQVYTLRGADESYRTLVEAMNEGAMILDDRETILYANRRLAEMLRSPLSGVIGARLEAFVPSDLRNAFRTLLEESETGPQQQETLLRASDRSLVPVQMSASPVRFEGVTGLCILVTDLTEQKEREAVRNAEQRAAQAEIQRHATELEASNRELEAFIYSVSHDLRAPLRHIHRFSTLVQEDYAETLALEARDFLSRVTSSAERMDRLIEGLLVYSRVSRGEIALRVVETSAIVEEVLRQLPEEIRESRGQITVEGPLLPVWGDVLLMTQAVNNLISNALKFVAPGATPRVRIRSEDRGSTVRFWVEDRGIGISAQNRDNKLFRVFERLGGDQYPGTGIGLAIVKRAADRMGGNVGVESEAGKGSRFWIELRSPGSPLL
jgi:PAS domain S-box-containing protein